MVLGNAIQWHVRMAMAVGATVAHPKRTIRDATVRLTIGSVIEPNRWPTIDVPFSRFLKGRSAVTNQSRALIGVQHGPNPADIIPAARYGTELELGGAQRGHRPILPIVR